MYIAHDGRGRTDRGDANSPSSTPITSPAGWKIIFRRFIAGNGLVAHECILDLRQFKSVTVEDVAKRLMDYGFHAPTISLPVPGTMMVEPTESESKEELDRFCDAMIAIHAEITAIESGAGGRAKQSAQKRAAHRRTMIAGDNWNRPYSREQAAFPAPWTARTQILAARRPRGQRLRRPQSGLHMRGDGKLFVTTTQRPFGHECCA